MKGQTLLITVLVLTIAVTVALSLIGKTTTDVRVSGQMEESARAFSAAEAGIEDVLKRASGITATIESDNGTATFTTVYTAMGNASSVYAYPAVTKKGDVATIWLVPHTTDGSMNEAATNYYCKEAGACAIDICWDKSLVVPSSTPTLTPTLVSTTLTPTLTPTGSPTPTPTNAPVQAALEATVIYKNTTTNEYDLQRFMYDPDATRIGNGFTKTGIGTTGCGKTSNVYQIQLTLPTTNTMLPLVLRLRPFYNDTILSVNPVGSRTLPAQSFEVSSIGKTESGVTRKIVVRKLFETPPLLLDHVLFSNIQIVHEAYNIPLP